MKDIENLTTGYTHGGTFHADDVFATAFLLTLNPSIKIERVFKVTPEMDSDNAIIFDIGEGEYDHHQSDKAVRPIEDGYYFENGEMKQFPYCAFGLLWRNYGYVLCPNSKAWKKVDHDLVLPIDKTDNGVEPNVLSAMIGRMNPTWKEPGTPDDSYKAFMDAVELAKTILSREIANANDEVEAEEGVLGSRVVDGNILVLDKYMPWQATVVEKMPEILYVVFPSNRGGFNVQTVPNAMGSFIGRKLFPARWLGNPDTSLGMTFCHPGNFILSADTEEHAINIAKIAVSE